MKNDKIHYVLYNFANDKKRMLKLKVKINQFGYFKNNPVLKNIEINIKEHDIVAIVGKNGSGKTTLLKIMDGLLKDFSGEVLVDGENVKSLTPHQIYSKMGLLFQNPDEQLFASTVFDDVAFGPYNMGYNDEEVKQRVKKALSMVGLEGFEQKEIHSLSFGQKKRLCIACLLSMGHRILLLDEPIAGIDPEGQKELVQLIRKLNADGITFVIATHDIDLIPLFVKKIYLLHDGTVVKYGAPEDVFSSKDVEEFGLRLPFIAELIYSLKDKSDNIKKLPLTVRDAKMLILQMLNRQ